ncbi:MAG: glycosyltransferase family 4 protein [Anaerolineales bacterium]|nr:glycosyltransferase family 4 protein [Anaerolineales bacterium]MDW8161069.1 glycosyltransferase family 4 protein [Anaerolineales bacterium]
MERRKPGLDWLITQMRIIGGVEKYASELALELSRRGWEIRLITLVEDSYLSRRLEQQGVPVISLGVKSKTDLSAWKRLEALWQEKKPVILHTHLFHAGILGRLVGRKVGIPIILCHQGGPEHHRSLFRTLLDACTSHLVTRYIVPCGAVASILNHRERIPPCKIDRIPNAIQPPPLELVRDSRKESTSPVRLVTVGRLVAEKAQWVMVRAVYMMAMRNLRPSLWILGEGPLRPKLQAQIQQLNLTQLVSLLGFQDDPYPWLCQAHFFLLASLWESLSLALMEAMAMALPVITTATGGTPELVSHLETGYLIPPNSPQALAEGIEFLLARPELAQQMGEKARRMILDHYTIPKVADQLEQYYQNLLEGLPLR